MKRLPLILCALLVPGLDLLRAGNWPQWRGPAGDGTSLEQHLPLHWSHTDNVAWKTEMPDRSASTPIVWGERVFLSVARERSIYLWCLDRSTGKERWSHWLSDGNFFKGKHNMSSPSPVTDGEHVWVLTGTGFLRAFDVNGRQIWSRDLQGDYGVFGLDHGYASSPLLHEGILYVQVVHGTKTKQPSYLLAIEGMTGATIWRVERPTDALWKSRDAYTSPVLLARPEGVQIVVSGGDYVTGHESTRGTELWRVGGLNPDRSSGCRIIASPSVVRDLLFVPSLGHPLLALRSRGPGKVERLWSTSRGTEIPSPLFDGERLYVVRDNGTILALDGLSGKLIWGPERLRPGTYISSPVLGVGRIYVTSEDGVTSVIRAAGVFELIAENEVRGWTLSSPALSDGQLFLRTAEYLYCLGTRRTAIE